MGQARTLPDLERVGQVRHHTHRATQARAEQLDALRGEAATIAEAIKGLEADITADENLIEACQVVGVLYWALHDSPTALSRDEIREKRTIAERDDITVGDVKRLQEEIATLERSLQRLCSHTLVFATSSYQGSKLREYENCYDARRWCVVCGFSEYGTRSSRRDLSDGPNAWLELDEFETFCPDERRVIVYFSQSLADERDGRSDLELFVGSCERWITQVEGAEV